MCPSALASEPTVKFSNVKENVAEPPSVVAETDIAGSVGASPTYTLSMCGLEYPYTLVPLNPT